MKFCLFSKQANFRVIFIVRNGWLIFKTGLLLNPANFQGLRVFCLQVATVKNGFASKGVVFPLVLRVHGKEMPAHLNISFFLKIVELIIKSKYKLLNYC